VAVVVWSVVLSVIALVLLAAWHHDHKARRRGSRPRGWRDAGNKKDVLKTLDAEERMKADALYIGRNVANFGQFFGGPQ
jgi:hypothetical protein